MSRAFSKKLKITGINAMRFVIKIEDISNFNLTVPTVRFCEFSLLYVVLVNKCFLFGRNIFSNIYNVTYIY